MSELALFDLDDTLIDREAAFTAWARHFVDEHQLRPDALDRLIQLDEIGKRPRELFFLDVKTMCDVSAPLGELLDEYASVYPTFYEADLDVIGALRRLRARNWKVGVVTNGPPSQMRKLEASKLVDEVDAVCVSGVLGVRKPDRRIFEEAATRCGRPLSGWMIGDSASADIVGGHGAGLRTIWMDRGRTWEYVELQPDGVAASIPAAVDILLK